APEAASPGRALDGPRTHLRGEDLRDRRRDQLPGDARPPRRAERADGARDGEPRLRHGDRADHAGGSRVRAQDERGGAEGHPRGRMTARLATVMVTVMYPCTG